MGGKEEGGGGGQPVGPPTPTLPRTPPCSQAGPAAARSSKSHRCHRRRASPASPSSSASLSHPSLPLQHWINPVQDFENGEPLPVTYSVGFSSLGLCFKSSTPLPHSSRCPPPRKKTLKNSTSAPFFTEGATLQKKN